MWKMWMPLIPLWPAGLARFAPFATSCLAPEGGEGGFALGKIFCTCCILMAVAGVSMDATLTLHMRLLYLLHVLVMS